MKYGLAAVLLAHLPFLGLALCGTAVSLAQISFWEEYRDEKHLRLSRDLLGTFLFHPIFLFATLILPFPLLFLICRRVFVEPGFLPWSYWMVPFGALVAGWIFLFALRSGIVRSADRRPSGFRAGAAGLLSLLLASFLLFVLLGTFLKPENLPLMRKNPIFILSWNSVASFLLFLAISLGFTGSVLFFIADRVGKKGKEDPGDPEYVRLTGRRLALCGAFAVPPLIVLTLLSIPATALSQEVFGFFAAVVILAMPAGLALALFPEKTAGKPALGIPVLYFLMFFAISLGSRAMGENSLFGWPAPEKKAPVAGISMGPDSIEIPQAAEPGLEKGRAIFGSACRACHLFETRIVGPPMKEVLPKYSGEPDRLKRFIKEPEKVDPAYPLMPLLGLKEDELEAVTGYLLGSIGEKLPPKEKPSPEAAAIENGKAVFESVCAGCHRFDTKVVGPALNEVVPNYAGNVEWLKNFIRNPVKKNPAYPSMPNLGLKEEDIDAVARYLVSQTGKGG